MHFKCVTCMNACVLQLPDVLHLVGMPCQQQVIALAKLCVGGHKFSSLNPKP